MKKINPFNPDHFIGYVCKVSPQLIEIHFPSSGLLKNYQYEGERISGGLVGEFIIIEDEKNGFLGKINETYILEKERSELSEATFQRDDFQPIGKVELFLSFSHYQPHSIKKGLSAFPQIGSKVYVAPSSFVQHYVERFGVREDMEDYPTIALGGLMNSPETKVSVSQQSLFGRHCAIVGTTGGGKSWTTTKLIEQVCSNGSKSILIDATGEYTSLDNQPYSSTPLILGKDSFLHYSDLTIEDLFVLFRPSGQVQQPILLEAMKSLKLVECLMRDKSDIKHSEDQDNKTIIFEIQTGKSKGNIIIKNGVLIKQNNPTSPVKNMFVKFGEEVDNLSNTNFSIQKLVPQIIAECYYDNGDQWSDKRDDRNFSNSTSLLLRIASLLKDSSFTNAFGIIDAKGSNVINSINDFINSQENLLRISFESVSYDSQLREILANALGTYLLNRARSGAFNSRVDSSKKPLILFLDEAHQFINKYVKDEYFQKSELNAYDLIAKECRKYGLFLCLSTQMPRDIPIGTLSQMGTFISHRLINHFDKEYPPYKPHLDLKF